MKLSLVLSSLFVSATVFAAPQEQKPTLSLREKALLESKVDGLNTSTATDAQVTGMLTLKDPRLDVISRSWNYFAGLSGQTFQAQGTASKSGTNSFNLSQNGSTFMPGIEVGVISHPLRTQSLLWRLGVRGKAQLSSQETEALLDSGFRIQDARLNSTLLSAGPHVSLTWEKVNWVALTFSPQYGSLTYTQTSSNDFANFSRNASFESLGYGLDFTLNKKWSFFTEWTQKTLNENNEIALQKDNFELGTRITW